MTLFLRTEMHRSTVEDGGIYMGALFFAVITIMFNGFSELSMTIMKLPVFYKQRDFLFFPAWAYSLPTWILKIPITFIEVGIWVFMTYYVVGFESNIERCVKRSLHISKFHFFGFYNLINVSIYRFVKQYFLLLCVNQTASGLFRLMGALGRNIIVANTFGSFANLTVLVLGGFILSRGEKNNSIQPKSFLWRCEYNSDERTFYVLHQMMLRNGGYGVIGSHQ